MPTRASFCSPYESEISVQTQLFSNLGKVRLLGKR
jgi:hypothetical protein